MQLLRKAPLFFGWLAFYIIAYGVTLLLALPFRGKDFQDLSTLIIFVLLLLVLFLLIGFLSFAFSIKDVAIPLYLINKMPTDEPRQVKMSAYLLRWLAYLFYLMLFCFPLSCGITGSPLVEDVIPYVWQLAASYLAYRIVVNELIEETGFSAQ